MKKTFTFLILALLAVAWCHAAPVTKTTAASQAKAFMAARHPHLTVNVSLALQARQKNMGKGAQVEHAFYYVFNCDNNAGFVIISGDDSTPQVLGYADSGRFDLANVPENMRTWLDGYAEEIAWARNNMSRVMGAGNGNTPQQARQIIEPLVMTQWSQENPYNQKCLTAGGEQAVTGCVATALAQVMTYHKWPRGATTAIPAYSNDDESYGELPSTTFDWDNMVNSYTGNETADDPQAEAVAELLYYCGHAVKMSYGKYASGADMAEAVNALPNFFGYENTPVNLNRGSFSNEQWENLIYNELQHGRPVLYSGRSSSNTGHAFICDGYDGEGLYHINWGWGGLSDGYFRLQALNPATQGTGGGVGSRGYTYNQTMLVGVSPKALDEGITGDDDEVNRVAVESFKLSDPTNNIYDYTGGYLPQVSVYYAFSVPVTGNYTLGFGLYHGDELLQSYSILRDYSLTSGTTWSFNSLNINGLGYGLADGTYQIKCISRPQGESQWYKNVDGDFKYIEVTIANGKATFVDMETYPEVQVTGVELVNKGGLSRHLRAYIKNDGEMNFSGSLLLMINDTIYSKENAYLNVGEVGATDFVFSYKNTAPVHLKIASRTSSNVVFDDENYQFVNTSSQVEPQVLAYEMRNLDEANRKMYGRLAEACFTLKNQAETDYNGTAELIVYRRIEPNSNRRSILTNTFDISLKAGETKQVVLTYKGLAYGDDVYFYVKCAGWSRVEGSGSSPFIVTPGYVEWGGTGVRTARELASTIVVPATAAAVSFDGLDISTMTITPNENPNTIYYFGGDARIPSAMNGKNVVKGSKAVGNVAFDDSHACFVPIDFDVDGTVAYSHLSTSTCNGKTGWQTVMVPFGVSQVVSGGETMDWNHEVVDDGQAFWLKAFCDVQDDYAHFENAKEWVANQPYLLGLPASCLDKDVVMSATNTRVYKTGAAAMVGSGYRFVGATCDQTLEQAYVMNSTGDAFVSTNPATIQAGQAYFVALPMTESVPVLYLNKVSILLGDVNGDGLLSVSDVMLIVNYALGDVDENFILSNADVNEDGNISVSDVTALVDLLLH